jgi:vitamin B12 transporter
MDISSSSPFIKPLGRDSVEQNQVGVYGAINFTAANGFNIEGGGRYNNHSKFGSNAAFNVNPSYLIRNQWKVFANVSTGYKTPSLFQLFSEYGNVDLQPETSLNLEGGLQYFTKDGKAAIRATYFNREVKDLITFFFDPVTFKAVYINRDKQKDNGIELDGKISLSDKVQIKAFYSYIDGEITTKKGSKDTTYFNLYRRPKSTLSFTLGTQVTKGLFTSLQLQSVSNTTDVTFDPPFFTQREVALKDYVLVSLYADYALVKNRLKVFADLRNITDEKYQEIYGYKAPGFNAYGGLRFNF